MRRILLAMSVMMLLFSIALEAQTVYAKDNYTKGKEAYDKDEYDNAILYLKKAIEAYPQYEDAIYYLAGSYYYNSNYDEAIETLVKLDKMNPDYWPWTFYWWGQCYYYKDDLENMKIKFEIFLKKYGTKPKNQQSIHEAKYKLRYATESQAIRKTSTSMEAPVSLGATVNSDMEDYQPQLNPTGKIMYFTSTRKGSPFNFDEFSKSSEWGEDIYIMEKTADGWGTPTPLPAPINSKNNDGSSSFSGDGQTMVYAACGREEGIGSCDLYIATLEGTQWSEPQNMGNVVNSAEWEAQPTISADGSFIIFCSERKGGYGSSDLYMITKNMMGEWGVPVNMGPMINTPSREGSPFLSADGKTLYFSSYGHPGYGGSDIFVSVYENGKWTEPKNMGAPLNSSKDDRNFTIGGTGEMGYFASERDGGLGMSDLYSVKIPESMRPQPTVIVSGIVNDVKTSKPIESWVLVEDINTSEMIAISKSNSLTGKYLVVLPSGRDYSVSANKEGYLFYSKKFDVPKGTQYKEITQNIPLTPIEKGAKVVLNNIFFETGKAILDNESQLELNKVIKLMKSNPTMKVELGGHTDNVGDDLVNMKLSHDRALSVRDFLVKGGIDPTRLMAKGYGKTMPVASNDTPEGRQANRRTEFIVIDF